MTEIEPEEKKQEGLAPGRIVVRPMRVAVADVASRISADFRSDGPFLGTRVVSSRPSWLVSAYVRNCMDLAALVDVVDSRTGTGGTRIMTVPVLPGRMVHLAGPIPFVEGMCFGVEPPSPEQEGGIEIYGTAYWS